ncbi:hypothetical protein BMS3Bbin10_02329 [bacterium BMS3Bbin10]|nr:hypothetical protein BMS3Bbin10_02329 [bacterium BMS3Bbin10]
MKNAVMALPVFGLILGFTSPVGATISKSLILQSNEIVQQQDTCKEDEVWDETLKKCVKKES